jgi:hypothetical protein
MIEAGTLLKLLYLLDKIKNLSTFKKRNKIKISAKHVVFISESSVQELLSGNTNRLKGPRTEPILVWENEIFEFAKQIYRPRFKFGNNYIRWEDTPIWQEKSHDGNLVYKKFTKDLFESELKKHDTVGYDCIKELFGEIDDTFSFLEFLKLSYFEDGCGGGGIIEHYEFKPIFIVALWIENLDEDPIILKNYKGKLYYPNYGFEFRKESWGFGEEERCLLPPVPLKKGESLLIPEILLLGEINDSGTSKPFLQFQRTEEMISFDIYDDPNKFLMFGPSLSIEEVNFEKASLNIHPFNSSRVLRLSKHYLVGSCPYIFAFDGKEHIYIKELFINSYKEEIKVLNYQYFIIAELEDEITYLDEIKLDTFSDESIYHLKDIRLKKGEFICIRCLNNNVNQRLMLSGFYRPVNYLKMANPDDIHNKIKIIENFILSKSGLPSRYCIRKAKLF